MKKMGIMAILLKILHFESITSSMAYDLSQKSSLQGMSKLFLKACKIPYKSQLKFSILILPFFDPYFYHNFKANFTKDFVMLLEVQHNERLLTSLIAF